MVFTKDSALVKVWVNLVSTGAYSREQVPNLFNLRSVVLNVIDVEGGEG